MVPVIDVGALVRGGGRREVAAELGRACRDCGFFYIVGHGVDRGLQEALEAQSRAFFALPLSRKLELEMARGGRAWRGYFPVGGELTSGQPDRKEGLYFGQELADSEPRVLAGLPLHGRNLFPAELPALGPLVLAYMAALTTLGHRLLEGLSLSLGLADSYFHDRYTADPLTLFRIFHYPRAVAGQRGWGVGEHTDYGLLTILKQDDCGGLEVKSGSRWIAAPPLADSFVCNIGDMLELLTGGRYVSTPHRVDNRSDRDRISFPFFFDPGWQSQVGPPELPVAVVGEAALLSDDSSERWDGRSVHRFRGSYGDYLLGKVGQVFPDLHRRTVSS